MRARLTADERRERARLRSERWRRAHGIGPRKPTQRPWLALRISRSTWYRRMRVATKYVQLTRRFFAERNVTDYRIVESLGATEGAPAAGKAEFIIDITTTGATLAANSLKVLDDGTILRSQANLAASLSADWNRAAREQARIILSQIAAEEEARTTREIVALLPRLNGGFSPKPSASSRPACVSMPMAAAWRSIARKTKPPRLPIGSLRKAPLMQGASYASVAAQDYVFSAANPLYERLMACLPYNPP